MTANTEGKGSLGEEPETEDKSRRSFLKALGLGAAGFGALSMIPSAASSVKITKNGIEMDGQALSNFVVDKVSGDPSNPEVGQMWYDTTAD